MKCETMFKKSVLVAAIGLLSACGGGSGSSTASGTSEGVITGFGSIYVNGVEYETDGADIRIDGAAALETSLGVGDVVRLQGRVNADGSTGVATSVICSDELEGYVLDLAGLNMDGTGTINVMGQTVTLTADTVFDSDTLAEVTDLSVNDIVEVSGFSDGAGSVLATRIETKSAAEDVEVKGVVSMLDSNAMTFMLGDLTVDYSSASEVAANLDDGLYVEAKTETTLSGDSNVGYTLLASKVEIEDDGDLDVDGEQGEDFKMQGMVSEVTDTSFRFNGTLVEFASLEIDDDVNPASLVDGMMITVEGYIDANGDFVVTEIEDEQGTELEVMGTVTAKTDTSVTILASGSTSMTFEVSNHTRMIDDQDEGVVPLHYFSLADVAIGDYVEIEYYEDATSSIHVATELEREDPPIL